MGTLKLTGIRDLHNVSVLVADLTRPPLSAAELWQTLSPDEHARAERFRFPHLRDRFRTGRGLLRVLVAQYCKADARELAFSYTAMGKPILPTCLDFSFNVSHSGDLFAAAVSRWGPVGIDIESIRPMHDLQSLARRFFALPEYTAIEGLDEAGRPLAFFRCWTRKEAYLKARGDGLSKGLSTFHVSCGEEETSPICDASNLEQWVSHAFEPAPGYVGALAVISREPG
ncbi:MAG: 4'-phosphopantetheinyl transferase superfamily protein [Acidobacteriota bacterium]|nr:4'-phosphopantetheinyl transferase superfamily protein [Acidobacteriota bacterium]